MISEDPPPADAISPGYQGQNPPQSTQEYDNGSTGQIEGMDRLASEVDRIPSNCADTDDLESDAVSHHDHESMQVHLSEHAEKLCSKLSRRP